MLKAAFGNYAKFFRNILIILLCYAVGVGLFAVIYYWGINLSLSKFSPASHGSFTDYVSGVVLNIKLQDVFSSDFLRTVVNGVLEVIKDISSGLKIQLLICLILCILAVIGTRELGEWICRKRMRKTLATSDTLTGVLAAVIRLSLTAALWVASAIVTYIWFFAIFLLPLVSVILGSVKNLVATWLIYFKKYPLRKVVNIKSLAKLTGTHLLLQLWHYMLFALIMTVFNTFFALIITLPLFSYGSAVMDVTAVRYYNSLKEKGVLDAETCAKENN